MQAWMRGAGAIAGLLLAGLAPVAALADTPFAVYQTTDRKMDFQLAHCGADEKALCVTLLAARGTADVPRVHAMLGRLIVDHAEPAGPNVWNGTISLYGFTGSGTLTLHPGTDFLLHGCAYEVICTDQVLIPAQ